MPGDFSSNSGRRALASCIAILLGGSLAACGGGGSDAPQQSQDPPPAPPTTPPPTPPPADPLPPLAATAIDINDNHAVGADHWPSGATSDGAQGQPVNGIECLANMPEDYHVHTHLSIFLNGEQLAVPGDVGIVTQQDGTHCFYTVHTHDKSGKLHVEAAAPGTYTLGQFFAEWGEPLATDNIAGLTGMPITVYMNDAGVVSKVTTEWKDIELKSHREITIQIGTAITEIPTYTWAAN
jgi:hypothetical protein